MIEKQRRRNSLENNIVPLTPVTVSSSTDFGSFHIQYKFLEIGDKIGSGASGDVFKYKISILSMKR